jgi:hypothetical protein
MCNGCLIRINPHKYYPCPCCRLPQEVKGLCVVCKNGILNTVLLNEYALVQKWEEQACKLLEPGEYIKNWYLESENIGDTIPCAMNLKHVKKTSTLVPVLTDFYPGFYFGDGVWIKLKHFPTIKRNAIVDGSN